MQRPPSPSSENEVSPRFCLPGVNLDLVLIRPPRPPPGGRSYFPSLSPQRLAPSTAHGSEPASGEAAGAGEARRLTKSRLAAAAAIGCMAADVCEATASMHDSKASSTCVRRVDKKAAHKTTFHVNCIVWGEQLRHAPNNVRTASFEQRVDQGRNCWLVPAQLSKGRR